MFKKLFPLALAILVVFTPIVQAENDATPWPDRHDWSATKTLLMVPRSPMLPPIAQDNQGNFHAYTLHIETSSLEHVVVDSTGEVILSNIVELPNVDKSSLLTAVPHSQGLQVVWATRDGEGNWLLYTALVLPDGSLADVFILEYDLNHPKQFINTQSGLMRTFISINAAMDNQGQLHLSLAGGTPREMRALYMVYGSDKQLIRVEMAAANHGVLHSRYAFSGGEILLDNTGTAYVLNDISGRLYLDTFGPDDTHTTVVVGRSAFEVAGFGSGGLYTKRRVGPVMVMDHEETIHVAYNYLTHPARFSAHIVDVAYAQIKNGEVVLERIITNSQGLSHYPTVTTNGDRVYIVWEETSGNTHELYYSILDKQGEILSGFNRMTWEQAYSRLGFLYADDQGQLHAFWWRPARDGHDRLAYKNTVDLVPHTIWVQMGFDPHNPDSSLAGQLFYYGALTIIAAMAQAVMNLYPVLLVVAALFVFYKLQFLDLLLERPWTLFLLLLVLMYPFMPRIVAAESAFPLTSGYHFFVWLTAAGITFLLMLTLKIRPNSTLNLILGCTIWLLAAMVMQMLPIVPLLFAI